MENPFEAKWIGVKIVYQLIQKVIHDTVEEFISTMDVSTMDAAEIRLQLQKKSFITLHVPSTKEEELDAMDWLNEIRRTLVDEDYT